VCAAEKGIRIKREEKDGIHLYKRLKRGKRNPE
jgi:hypothetical protein